MSNERETREMEIGSNKVVVKTYATGREVQAIQQTYFKGAAIELIGKEPTIKDFNPAIRQEVEAEMIRQLVVSLNDSVENILDRCLDLPNDEYEELIAVLDELASKKKN